MTALLVIRRRIGDIETPVGAMLKLGAELPGSFLFESIAGGERLGRYSFIGIEPGRWFRIQNGVAESSHTADFSGATTESGTPIEALRRFVNSARAEAPAGIPPMASGAFGYLGYDMIRLVERLPHANPDPLGLPDAVLLRPSVVAVLDGVKGDVILVAPAWADTGLSARAAYAQAAERVMDAQRAIDRGLPQESRALGTPRPPGEPVSNFSHAGYLAAVERAKDYIRAGDIFQVVPAQRWTLDFHEPPFALYRSLRRTNPSPFMFYFNFGGFQVVGASPEILVRVFGRQITIRPIAGTRPRGATPEEDRANEAALLADVKERAEHLMLLDLGRNDVGRVARIGTVRPTEQFVVERYSHVMHIVSNVTGDLAEGQDALSAFFAGMPAGTVSGAPKVRAMEIIDELEPEKRGIYGGGLGYFSAGGDMDMCIALRTAVMKDEKLYIQAGGGVVFDSEPEAEYEETVHKSRAIRRAAEDAAMFRPEANR